MLKVRVVPTLLFKDVGLVKGVRFSSDRRVGGAVQAVNVYDRREVDELVFFDITASLAGRPPDFTQIDDLADECFMPMTVGGGVSTLAHIAELLAVGADKVVVNSGAFEHPELISNGAALYGAQCIVVGIDVRREDGGWRVYSHCGTRPTGYEAVKWAREVERRGAGEIILTSIDRDGTMEGYDTDLTRRVTEAVALPVVASGGAGRPEHAVAAIREGGASAVAAASIFHFTEITPRDVKLALREHDIPVRL
jgi:imidazole glycerol-phosphate synthase subunit HisF